MVVIDGVKQGAYYLDVTHATVVYYFARYVGLLHINHFKVPVLFCTKLANTHFLISVYEAETVAGIIDYAARHYPSLLMMANPS